MEIRRIEYKNVYGTLSGKLDFSQGENFLVGINGCGKTTVLNLIRWVLGPCFPELCTLQHDLIKIDVKHGKYLYSIQSRILKDNFHELKVVTKDKSRDFKPIKAPLSIKPSELHGMVDDVRDQYEHLAPEPHEIEAWHFLMDELPSPVFIGLKRSIEDDLYVRTAGRNPKRVRYGGPEPLLSASVLMRDAFNTSRRKIVEISEELNRQVLALSFSGVIHSMRPVNSQTTKTIAKKIERLKARFKSTTDKGSYSKTLSDDGVRGAIVKYLDELTDLLNKDGSVNEAWVMLNQNNFDRAVKMFDLFEMHESNAQSAQHEITVFSDAVNKFIGDSGKSIYFNDDTGEPYFKSEVKKGSLSLTELSSGESQVIVLLSYFAFLAIKGNPIIIDEPELSLHVQWQKYFVNSVKEVMPDECQTIMATHSPEICGAEDVNVQSISVRRAK